jgi:hypothetical protein
VARKEYHHPIRDGVWWNEGEHFIKAKTIPDLIIIELIVFGRRPALALSRVAERIDTFVLENSLVVGAGAVGVALNRLLDSLEVSEEEKNAVDKALAHIEKSLNRYIKLTKFEKSGSYARGTALNPLHDVDFIAVLKDSYWEHKFEGNP